MQCIGPDNTKVFFDVLFFKNDKDETRAREQIKILKDSEGAQGIAECYYDYEYWTEDLVIYNLFLQENMFADSKPTIMELTKEKVNALRGSIISYDERTLKNLKGG